MKTKLLKFLPFALLTILICIAYGQTLRMYFWQDDSALIFKLQHQAEAAGSFGTGLWERSPYQYLVVPFVPFFSIFKLEPFGYFLVGFLSYFVVTFFFWLFSFEIFQNKKSAYISTLIFAAGYVGSDIMFRVINSWQTNIGLILALITMKVYIRYLRKLEIRSYILAVLLFLLTIEAVYIRSHSLIFSMLAIDVVYCLPLKNIKQFFMLMVRQIPFWFLFYKWYVAGQSIGAGSLGGIFKKLLEGQIGILTSLFATVGNALVSDILQGKFINKFANLSHLIIFVVTSLLGVVLLSQFTKSRKVKIFFLVSNVVNFLCNSYFYSQSFRWYRTIVSEVSGFIGIYGLILAIFLAISLWKKSKVFSIGVVLGYVILISQVFGYFVQYPESIFGTTHRYLSNASIGYTLFYGSIFSAIFTYNKKRKFVNIIPLVILLSVNLYFGYKYQRELVNIRSIPTRKFYQDLKKFVPNVSKGDVFYFDVERNPLYERQFGDFFSVGSMPETTALAIYYNVDRYDISMFTNFEELVASISDPKTNHNNIYTFFYGRDGLKDTTLSTKKLLEVGSVAQTLSSDEENILRGEVSTTTPQLLNLDLIISQSNYPKFPYSFAAPANKTLKLQEKVEMLKYLTARNEYYKNVKITSLSEWKYSEVDKAFDNNFETGWQSHRTRWDTIKDDNLTADLGAIKTIYKLYWTNLRNTLTPSDYEISTSLDGKNWIMARTIKNGPERKNGEIVSETFDTQKARYVKMRITKTVTDDSPAVAEFEIVENGFDVDLNSSLAFMDNPFGYIRDENEWDTIYRYIVPLTKMSVVSFTNKANSKDTAQKLPIFLDNKIHTYQIVAPSGGTTLEKYQVGLNFPANIQFVRGWAKSLSLNDLKTRGLIKFFSTN